MSSAGPSSGFKLKLKLSASTEAIPGNSVEKVQQIKVEEGQVRNETEVAPARASKLTLRFGEQKAPSIDKFIPLPNPTPREPPLEDPAVSYAAMLSSVVALARSEYDSPAEIKSETPREDWNSRRTTQSPAPSASYNGTPSAYAPSNPYAKESTPIVRFKPQPAYQQPLYEQQPAYQSTSRQISPPYMQDAMDADYSHGSPTYSNASFDDGDSPFKENSRGGSVASTSRQGSTSTNKRKRSPVESKAKKSKTLVSGQFSIPRITRLENGTPALPIPVGVLVLRNLGTILTADAFHTPRYIYPIDYECARPYPSMIDPAGTVEYVSRISRTKGSPDVPFFTVEPADQPGFFITGASPTAAWSQILKTVNELRQRKTSNSISGPDYFGFSQNVVKALIQELPGARDLPNYVWQEYLEEAYEPPVEVYKPLKKYKKREKEVRRELSEDPYNRRGFSPALEQNARFDSPPVIPGPPIDPYAIPEPEYAENVDPYALPFDSDIFGEASEQVFSY